MIFSHNSYYCSVGTHSSSFWIQKFRIIISIIKAWRHISAFFGNKSSCSRWDMMKWPGLLREGTLHFITAKLVFVVGTVPICQRQREREEAFTIPGLSMEFVSNIIVFCLRFVWFCIRSSKTLRNAQFTSYFVLSFGLCLCLRAWQQIIYQIKSPKTCRSCIFWRLVPWSPIAQRINSNLYRASAVVPRVEKNIGQRD